MQILLVIAGSISLALGIIGIFLPLLPTTPFLLLSAICYLNGSKKMYLWLINNKYFGKYIKDYQEKRGVKLKMKIFAILLLWITILNCIVFLIISSLVNMLLITIALAVSAYIIKLKTVE
ncbi:MAG: YbaN family protein [Bacteroidota bacterium]